MIRAMRSSAKWVMGILVIAFVGWMVFDVGMDVMGRGGYRMGDAIAKVNGRSIELQTYFTALRDAQERQRRQLGTAPLTQEDQQALQDAVLEELIQEILLNEEFRRRNIKVTEEEILAAARTSPPPEVYDLPIFQTEGQFDLQKYQRFLAAGTDPAFLQALENRYRQEIPRAKLYDQLVADVFLSDAKLWQAYKDQHDSVRIRLLALFPDAVIPDSEVAVTDAEVRAYYDRNRREFERPAVAYLSYISVSRLPNGADSAAALERARSIRREILGGADFAEVAKRESADSASGAKGGDLGEVARGTFIPEFEQAALALRPGQVSEPVLTPFGYHIIKLESRTGDRFRARHILIPIEPVGEHLEAIDAMVDSLDRHAAEQIDPAALDSAAARLGLPVRVAPPLREGERLTLAPYVIPDVGIWAFEARPGDTSPVIEARHAFYLFRLDSLTPGGVPPLDQIRGEVRRAVMRQKKREALRQLAGRLALDVKEGATIAVLSEKVGVPASTVGPFTRANPPALLLDEPKVIGAAFGIPVGKVGGPINGESAIFFLEPIARTLADSAAWREQLDAQRERAIQIARESRVRTVLNSMRASAQVTDRRKELERAQREAEERARNVPRPVAF